MSNWNMPPGVSTNDIPGQDATESAVVVNWCDDAMMMSLAKARGWTEDQESASILDLVDESECEKSRVFPSVTKAKDWARRNKELDFWRQPSILVYEWPSAARRSWERETVRHLRYVGDGCGWDEIT